MSHPIVILGLGFTTQRLARRLLLRNVPVFAAVRNAERFGELATLGVRLCGMSAVGLPHDATIVHSIPPVNEPDRSAIRTLIRELDPRRILYISSTGVYGDQQFVNEATILQPNDDKGHARADDEAWIAAPDTPWSSLILRSAAIYGPGRGIHVRLREGKLARGSGGLVSRIHVDDLAALLDAGISSPLEGAWPVADDLPATSGEVQKWCAELMGLRLPDSTAPTFPVAGRSVDGKKLRELLSVELKYSSYRTGIPASLRQEKGGEAQ